MGTKESKANLMAFKTASHPYFVKFAPFISNRKLNLKCGVSTLITDKG